MAIRKPVWAALILAPVFFGAAWADEAPDPDGQRGKLLAVDADLRAKYGRPNPRLLAEGRRTLPKPAAPTFDWVKQLGLTPIHYQGPKPDCTAQACVAALEWNWQLRNGTKKPTLSPQPILDHLQRRGSLSFPQALDELLLHGTATLAAYPPTMEPGPVRPKVKLTHRIVGWARVDTRGDGRVERIKEAVLEHGPVMTVVRSTPAFQAYKGGVFRERYQAAPGDSLPYHAVVVIGWDDKLGTGCWHIQNSWGVGWGEGGGGMWIEYGSNEVGLEAYWLRAQANQYDLPADAHKLLGERASPFPRHY